MISYGASHASGNKQEFAIVFQSLVCPAITGAEDGVFNLEEGTGECIRLNQFYVGKVNHFLVPVEQLKRQRADRVDSSPCVAPPGNGQPLDADSSEVEGDDHV